MYSPDNLFLPVALCLHIYSAAGLIYTCTYTEIDQVLVGLEVVWLIGGSVGLWTAGDIYISKNVVVGKGIRPGLSTCICRSVNCCKRVLLIFPLDEMVLGVTAVEVISHPLA